MDLILHGQINQDIETTIQVLSNESVIVKLGFIILAL